MKDKAKKGPEMMDPSLREGVVGVPATNRQRVCYTIQTLVAEFSDLFPETPVEYSNYDGRNTALDVSFNLTVLPEDGTRQNAITLLYLVSEDERVKQVISEDDVMLVSVWPNPRTQDDRTPFNLGDAYLVLAGDE